MTETRQFRRPLIKAPWDVSAINLYKRADGIERWWDVVLVIHAHLPYIDPPAGELLVEYEEYYRRCSRVGRHGAKDDYLITFLAEKLQIDFRVK
ncbi:hypothetical protein HanPI659440_Chr05g0185521 [Helianthus annuus]|nr:hypothetical protein HanPI659440_Chr05g0185521 [Helianthus annuus]